MPSHTGASSSSSAASSSSSTQPQQLLSDDLDPGDIQFYGSCIPPLKDQTYTITATPSLTYNGTDLTGNDSTTAVISQQFTISGPRFVLDASDIHALYPAADSSGQFDTDLPCIVFNKRTLPWERYINPQTPSNSPWLALLVFDESEAPEIQSSTVGAWLADSVSTVPKNLNVSPTEQSSNCQTITLDSKLFLSVAPAQVELPYLSHVRQINTGDREVLGLKDDGWFSVVLSNRFPKGPDDGGDPIKHEAYLVSLEGLDGYINGTPLTTPIRLAVLMHWSFYCLPDPKANFEQLMCNVVLDQQKHPVLCLPQPNNDQSPAATMVTQRFAQGYVPLEYTPRTGESTFAWYRGPFAAVNLAPLPGLQPPALADQTWATGDHTRIYNSSEGVFDLSYKTAWDLGRGLVLADADFTQSLMALRLATRNQLNQQAVQASLQEKIDPSLRASSSSSSSAGSAAHPILYAFAKGAINLASQMNEKVLGPGLKGQLLSAKPRSKTAPIARFLESSRQGQLFKALQSTDWVIPQNIVNWVADKNLLKGIPFRYLVAEPRLLPMESLRFFYMDSNWVDCLLNGVFSVGLHTQQAAQDNEGLKVAVKTAVQAANPNVGAPSCGLLFRSEVVSSWPALAVRLEDTTVHVVRQERLAPDVLLCLFDKNPGTVIVAEPQEQLRFGCNLDDKGQPFFTVRTIIGTVGQPLPDTVSPSNANGFWRPAPATRVLNITDSAGPSSPTLLNAFQNYLRKGDSQLRPAEIAIQMIKAPLAAQFKSN